MKIRKFISCVLIVVGFFVSLYACCEYDSDWITFQDCLKYEIIFLPITAIGIIWFEALKDVEEMRKNRNQKNENRYKK